MLRIPLRAALAAPAGMWSCRGAGWLADGGATVTLNCVVSAGVVDGAMGLLSGPRKIGGRTSLVTKLGVIEVTLGSGSGGGLGSGGAAIGRSSTVMAELVGTCGAGD